MSSVLSTFLTVFRGAWQVSKLEWECKVGASVGSEGKPVRQARAASQSGKLAAQYLLCDSFCFLFIVQAERVCEEIHF